MHRCIGGTFKLCVLRRPRAGSRAGLRRRPENSPPSPCVGEACSGPHNRGSSEAEYPRSIRPLARIWSPGAPVDRWIAYGWCIFLDAERQRISGFANPGPRRKQPRSRCFWLLFHFLHPLLSALSLIREDPRQQPNGAAWPVLQSSTRITVPFLAPLFEATFLLFRSRQECMSARPQPWNKPLVPPTCRPVYSCGGGEILRRANFSLRACS